MSEEKTEEKVEKTAYLERLAICKLCPKRQGRLLPMSTCGVCGCAIAAKAAIPAWHCPLKFW